MKRSFYHYMLTLRGPNISDDITSFANNIGNDITFPKHSESYDDISNYLELASNYLNNMDIFDQCWALYLDHN